jgi:hypothetical protein
MVSSVICDCSLPAVGISDSTSSYAAAAAAEPGEAVHSTRCFHLTELVTESIHIQLGSLK